jgi:CrcB protein
MTVLLVLLGGAVGATLRYLTGVLMRGRLGAAFPWGTFVVNAAGSLVLGVTAGAVAAASGPEWALTLVGTGLCGALTTFSTFGYETARMAELDRIAAAGLNVLANVVGCLGACAGGYALAAAVV